MAPYHREDVRSLMCYIVKLYTVLFVLLVSRNHVLGDTLEFVERKADEALNTESGTALTDATR